MDTQTGLKGKLHHSEVALAKKNWRFLNASHSSLPSAKEEKRQFLVEYAGCKEVMDYVRKTQQPIRESDRTYQHNLDDC